MSNWRRHTPKQHNNQKSILVLFFLLLVWSITIGGGMALAMGNDGINHISVSTLKQEQTINDKQATKSIDPVPSRYQLGQELYLDNCSSCHIAIPPAILPTETWRKLLLELDQHYGQKLPTIIRPSLRLMWNYLQFASRPSQEGEKVPYRVDESRFFRALHPRVEFSQAVSYRTCISCHPGVDQFNYRRLTPEWEDAP